MNRKNRKNRLRIASLCLTALILNSCSLREAAIAEEEPHGLAETLSGMTALRNGTADGDGETDDPDAAYSDFDLDETIPEDAVRLELSGDTASFDGGSVLLEGDTVTIRRAGTYLLRGSWNGQIVVRAGAGDDVRLILDGAELTGTMAPLLIRSAKNVCVTLAEGSSNTITDTADYAFSEGEDEPDAALFSKCDLTINGAGSLTVAGKYACGIRSKDDLTIVNGELTVSAVTDAVKGKDSLRIRGGTLTVEAGEDGLKSNNDEDEEKGFVVLDGGEITIRAGDDAIHGESRLTVNGGTVRIESCYEGLEAKKVEIYGGDLTVNAEDDAINAASGSSSGENPDFGGRGGFDGQMPNAFDRGERDSQPPELPGGMQTNSQPPELPDGMQMNSQPPELPGGMQTTDQPPEKPDGTDRFPQDNGGRNSRASEPDRNRGGAGGGGGRFGGGGMPSEEPEEGVSILIAGGVIRASGRSSDVIDSNGTFEQTGGVLITEAANMTMYGEPDGILDTNGSLTFRGGTFVSLCRSAGTNYEELFAFPSVSVSMGKNVSRITLTSEDGTVLLDLVPGSDCRTLFFASDRLAVGESCTLTLDDEAVTFRVQEGTQILG